MCSVCGCDDSPKRPVEGQHSHVHAHDQEHVHTKVSIEQAVMSSGNAQAAQNRAVFEQADVLVVNLMSSPGSGKTTLLEETVDRTGLRIAVIEGDLATENDAERMRSCGVQAEQITTGIACHLDAHMIAEVLNRFDLPALDVLFIENVGNLICPACFDLGQHHNVSLLSVPEGDDKPEKYPVMFRNTDLMLVTKTDYLTLAPRFSVDKAVESLRRVGSGAEVIALSSTAGDGLDEWLDWLDTHKQRAAHIA